MNRKTVVISSAGEPAAAGSTACRRAVSAPIMGARGRVAVIGPGRRCGTARIARARAGERDQAGQDGAEQGQEDDRLIHCGLIPDA